MRSLIRCTTTLTFLSIAACSDSTGPEGEPVGPPPAPGVVNVLDHRVLDAEYDVVGDRLVTVSSQPATLHHLDAYGGGWRSIALPKTPTVVAVAPGGSLAAVGHDAWITIVDLVGDKVIESYPVTADVSDLVLPGNGWVYAIPRRDQWESIRSIDLATGEEHRDSGTIRAGTGVRLHPSLDYIYGANRGLSPSDFEKYDIRDGGAKVMYDSPYHGDFAFSGDVWITEDGTRLIARSANTFRSSPSPAEDIRYAGALPGMSRVAWAVSSTALGRIVCIQENEAGELRFYDDDFLEPTGTLPLTSFETPTGPVASHARFVFFRSDGNRMLTLVQADPTGGLSADWGLIVDSGALVP